MNILNIVDTGTTTSAADGLALINNKWIEPDTATLSMVKLDGDNSDIKVIGNFVQLGVKNNTPANLDGRYTVPDTTAITSISYVVENSNLGRNTVQEFDTIQEQTYISL